MTRCLVSNSVNVMDVRDLGGPELNNCAYRIETQVARSMEDSGRLFGKSGRLTLNPT